MSNRNNLFINTLKLPKIRFFTVKIAPVMKSLLQFAVVLIIAILLYNYFYGTSEEKAQSKEVFVKSGQTLAAAWDLLKSEKAKFDAGKYDAALDKLGGAYRTIRMHAQHLDANVLQRLDELETRKRALEGELQAIEQAERTVSESAPGRALRGAAESGRLGPEAEEAAAQLQRKAALLRSMESLIRDTDALLKEAGKE
ncbi:MAG: hypothetical protein RL742_1858 [Bacteroidota bacterium]